MDLAQVREQVEKILEMDRHDADPEGAHHLQDGLWVEILRAVADGHPDSAEMAREVLRLEDSPGSRWYA